MCLNKIKVLMIFLLLTTLALSQPVYAETVDQLDNLPGYGEELVLTGDSVFTVDEGETAVLAGNLTVWGQGDALTVVRIVVYGTLVVNGSLTCNHANLTLQNEGTLRMEKADVFTVGSGSLLYLQNNGTWIIGESVLFLGGGTTYLANYGSLTAEDWNIESQNGRIYFHNGGDISVVESSFSSTAPSGIFIITNNASMQIHQSVWNINNGGTISFDGRSGTLLLNGSVIEGSGQADGRQSLLTIYNGYTTLIDSRIDAHDCSSVYDDSRDVNMTNSVLSGIGNYHTNRKVYAINSTISDINNYNNAGHFFMINGTLSGINNYANFNEFNVTDSTIADIRNYNNAKTGNFTVTECTISALNMNLKNDGNMVFDSTSLINRGGNINIVNDAELYCRGLVLTTESATAKILLTNNGNITFTTPFIEQVSSSDLTSIGADGKQFLEALGGTITVVNLGSIKEEAVANDDSTIFYVLGAAAVLLLVIAFFVLRKKKQTNVNTPQ